MEHFKTNESRENKRENVGGNGRNVTRERGSLEIMGVSESRLEQD